MSRPALNLDAVCQMRISSLIKHDCEVPRNGLKNVSPRVPTATDDRMPIDEHAE
jgi:hypothetical protein